MSETVADYLLQRLAGEWGVKRIYGYPGRRHQRHHGRLQSDRSPPDSFRYATKRWPPSWPAARQVHRRGRRLHGDFRAGAIHLLNGLYDAKMDHQPVVAIVGTGAFSVGGNYQQEVDLLSL